jgi:glycosyltransferase involved in cell wall biosynthesis
VPKFSAIICVFNQPLVKEAIESVLDQRYADFELIVIDDGSSDETPKILAQYRGQAIILRQKNQGIAAARNAGLKLARGEFIAFLDSDDLWLPDYLAMQAGFLADHPELSLSFTDGWMIWGAQVPEGIASRPTHYSLYPPAAGPEAAKISFHSPIITSFTAFRREFFQKAGYFDSAFRVHEDAELFLRGFELGLKFGFLNQPLAIKRNLEGRLSLDRDRFFAASRDLQLLSWRRSKRLRPLLRESIPIADRMLARELLVKSCVKEARACLYEALCYKPWAVRTFLIWLALFLPEPVPTLVLTRNILPPDKKRLYGAKQDQARDQHRNHQTD